MDSTSVRGLHKEKNAIRVASDDAFIPTLNLIKQAMQGSELDKELEAKSTSLRLRFTAQHFSPI